MDMWSPRSTKKYGTVLSTNVDATLVRRTDINFAMDCYNVGPPRELSWFITRLSMVYGRSIHSYIMGFINQLANRGPTLYRYLNVRGLNLPYFRCSDPGKTWWYP